MKASNFIQQFHDFTDKYGYINNHVGFEQDNPEHPSQPHQWYLATKTISSTFAIRLSFIVESPQDYLIYLENFKQDKETKEWTSYTNSLKFKSTCKIPLEEALLKWNHQLTI